MSPLSRRLNQAAGTCVRLIDLAAAILAAAMTVLVFAQVVVRYVLGGSLVWSEELTRVLFVWMVLLAATTASPMRIDFIVGALPTRSRAAVEILAEAVVFGLTCYLVWGALGMRELTEDDRFTALDLSVSGVYLALIVSGSLWLVASLARAVKLAASLLQDPRVTE